MYQIGYIQEHFGPSASIVFDGYSEDPDIVETKSWERLRRTKKHLSIEVKFDKNSVPMLLQKKFLSNEKIRLIFLNFSKL